MDSELRQDLVSGDWIVVVPGRAKRPHEIIAKLKRRVRSSKKECPFENPQASGNKEPVFCYPNPEKWKIQIIENKYPAVTHKELCAEKFKKGPYEVIEGRGYHEILITKDHDDNFAKLSREDANLVFRAFGDRYRSLAKDDCLSYISIFHNWGQGAGASVYHPHYQLVAIPVIPPDVDHSLRGSGKYYKKNKVCVHCTMMSWEKKEKKRIVYENSGAIVFTPFVSREPFELRVFPKKHEPYFEESSEKEISSVVDALQASLLRIENRLNDPDYNFFIHTAPLKDKKKHIHYHWHIEILPKISVSAGFELGTGIEVTVVDPDEAAKTLISNL